MTYAFGNRALSEVPRPEMLDPHLSGSTTEPCEVATSKSCYRSARRNCLDCNFDLLFCEQLLKVRTLTFCESGRDAWCWVSGFLDLHNFGEDVDPCGASYGKCHSDPAVNLELPRNHSKRVSYRVHSMLLRRFAIELHAVSEVCWLCQRPRKPHLQEQKRLTMIHRPVNAHQLEDQGSHNLTKIAP